MLSYAKLPTVTFSPAFEQKKQQPNTQTGQIVKSIFHWNAPPQQNFLRAVACLSVLQQLQVRVGVGKQGLCFNFQSMAAE